MSDGTLAPLEAVMAVAAEDYEEMLALALAFWEAVAAKLIEWVELRQVISRPPTELRQEYINIRSTLEAPRRLKIEKNNKNTYRKQVLDACGGEACPYMQHRSSQRWHEGRHDLTPWCNFFLAIVRRACAEFDKRAGQVKAPRGGKTALIEAAIDAQPNLFTVADLQAARPGVSLDMIRHLLKRLKGTKVDASGAARRPNGGACRIR